MKMVALKSFPLLLERQHHDLACRDAPNPESPRSRSYDLRRDGSRHAMGGPLALHNPVGIRARIKCFSGFVCSDCNSLFYFLL